VGEEAQKAQIFGFQGQEPGSGCPQVRGDAEPGQGVQGGAWRLGLGRGLLQEAIQGGPFRGQIPGLEAEGHVPLQEGA
jgi:hypothetical protein